MIFKKSIFFLLFPAFLFPYLLHGQTHDADRKELQELLLERQQKFAFYTVSLDKKSGFFGNKTKQDILHSNEILIDIVKTDNKIISSLNRVVDFRNYEKINFSYDKTESEERLKNLLHATDTLSKQVNVLTAANADLKSSNLRLLSVAVIFVLITIALIVLRVLKKLMPLRRRNQSH